MSLRFVNSDRPRQPKWVLRKSRHHIGFDTVSFGVVSVLNLFPLNRLDFDRTAGVGVERDVHCSINLDDGANRTVHPPTSVCDGVVSQEHDPSARLELEFLLGRQLSPEITVDDCPRDLNLSR